MRSECVLEDDGDLFNGPLAEDDAGQDDDLADPREDAQAQTTAVTGISRDEFSPDPLSVKAATVDAVPPGEGASEARNGVRALSSRGRLRANIPVRPRKRRRPPPGLAVIIVASAAALIVFLVAQVTASSPGPVTVPPGRHTTALAVNHAPTVAKNRQITPPTVPARARRLSPAAGRRTGRREAAAVRRVMAQPKPRRRHNRRSTASQDPGRMRTSVTLVPRVSGVSPASTPRPAVRSVSAPRSAGVPEREFATAAGRAPSMRSREFGAGR